MIPGLYVATWSQADIDALKAAIAQSGAVLTVSYDGPPRRSVTYRSLKEMMDLLAVMTAEVSAASGQGSYRLGATRKGL